MQYTMKVAYNSRIKTPLPVFQSLKYRRVHQGLFFKSLLVITLPIYTLSSMSTKIMCDYSKSQRHASRQ